MLIIANTGFTKVEYTYFDYQDGQDAFCGKIDGCEKVKVFKLEDVENDLKKLVADIHYLRLKHKL